MGWDIDRFPEGEVNLELICCICTCILEDPVESPCRHVFCSQCIKTWLSNQKSCPSCRAPVLKKDLQPVVPLLRNIISKQRIFCDNKDRGCEELVPLENLPGHVATCVFGLVSCPNEGCNVKVMRKDHKAHSEICLKRTIMCEHGCEMFLTLGEKLTHNCIRAMRTHFQETTNELLSRVSKLEELVNMIVSKNQSQRIVTSRPSGLPLVIGSSDNGTRAPYFIPSPRQRRFQVSDDDIAIGSPINLTNYTIDNNDMSDSNESLQSDIIADIAVDREMSPVFEARPRHRGRERRRHRGERHQQSRHRSRSPYGLLPLSQGTNAASTVREAHGRNGTDRPAPGNNGSPAYTVQDDVESHGRETGDEPLVLRIGVSSQTVSDSSSSSTSSSSDSESD